MQDLKSPTFFYISVFESKAPLSPPDGLRTFQMELARREKLVNALSHRGVLEFVEAFVDDVRSNRSFSFGIAVNALADCDMHDVCLNSSKVGNLSNNAFSVSLCEIGCIKGNCLTALEQADRSVMHNLKNRFVILLCRFVTIQLSADFIR